MLGYEDVPLAAGAYEELLMQRRDVSYGLDRFRVSPQERKHLRGIQALESEGAGGGQSLLDCGGCGRVRLRRASVIAVRRRARLVVGLLSGLQQGRHNG